MKFSAGEVVHILLDKQCHLGLVCEEQPLRVRESKVFIVDTNKLSHPDDLKADDLGSWKNDGQHSHWVKVKQMGGCVTKLEFCSGKPTNNPNAYRLHRHYFVHHSNSQFEEDCISFRYEKILYNAMSYSLHNYRKGGELTTMKPINVSVH